jgi:hypothetical protein
MSPRIRPKKKDSIIPISARLIMGLNIVILRPLLIGNHNVIRSLFTRLIIRLFQLVFSAETVFFSHNKLANSVFQPAYQPS